MNKRLKKKMAVAATVHRDVELSKALEKIEELKDKVTSYMESANMYKCENEDLRAICNSYEEMVTENKKELENANKKKLEVLELNEQILKEKQKVEYQLVTQHKDIIK